METKKLAIILGIIIVIIAIICIIFSTGMFQQEKAVKTTPFKTSFMEGSFIGNVSLENDDEDFMHSYVDKQHNITYNVSTVDNSSALMDIYYIQGVMNPEHRTLNGNDWNIYFTQAVPENGSDNDTMNIIICQSQGKKQGYLLYIIFGSNSDVNSTANIFGESYTDYVEPLLKSITLKTSKNVPKINEEFGLSEDEFAQQMDYVKQYKSGNVSALEG